MCIPGEIKLPKGYCDAELSLDSRLEVLLPRRQGLGLCSTALASYLIGLHNDLVHSVHRHTKEEEDRCAAAPLPALCCIPCSPSGSFPCSPEASPSEHGPFAPCRYLVSPSEVADLHLISYEVERDLIPLILANCQYSMEKGGETLQDFDLERIQQQVISKFLQGKPLITLTVGGAGLCSQEGSGSSIPGFTSMVFSPDRESPPWCTDTTGTTSSCSVMSGTSWSRWVSALQGAGQA